MRKPWTRFYRPKRWAKEAENTLTIDSNIPIGYGLGSSGAVTACIYERYAVKTTKQETTRTRLAQMESFFHGKSSGIDPWVSYSQQSWLFQGNALHAADEDRIRTFTEECVLVDRDCTKHKVACRTFSGGAKKDERMG